MSSPKKRIKRAREAGNHELADWVEARERVRAAGGSLAAYDRDNPQPGTEKKKTPADLALGKISVPDEDEALSFEIPHTVREVLSAIVEKKGKLKKLAHKAHASGAATELKTYYKLIKRLDSEYKRLRYEYDFKAFDDYFFQEIQDRVDSAPFHFDMVKMYNSSKRCCVVCPRGHAKSTTARKYLLHQILYKKTSYVIMVGASEEMAAQNMRWVRDQLTENELILEVYGWLKNKDKWADSTFQTNTGIKVTAKGAGQKIRGANERGRPDLIYIDDLEEDEQVSSRDRREKLREWFSKALMPAKSREGRVIITGTILHIDSLLKNISDNKVKDHIDWEVLWYQAITTVDGKERALWPEHKPLEELRKLREIDPETFAQEYQNSPTSGSMAVFDRKEYNYFSHDDIQYDSYKRAYYVRGKQVHLMLTPDLALSEKEGSDYTVLMMTGMDEASNLYVLEYERYRSSDPYQQIEMMFEMCAKWDCDYMTMETVAFQKVFQRILEYEMGRRGINIFVHELTRHMSRKIYRIKGLKAPIRGQKIFWMHEHTELEDELEQVTATSLGVHDDVIDALADAWQVQLDLYEERVTPRAQINSIEWAIEGGLLPTEIERMEMEYYYGT